MACQDSTTPRTCEHCQAPIENRQEHSAKYCTHKCLRAAEYLRDNATIKARSAGYREAHRKELAAAARAYRKDNRDAIATPAPVPTAPLAGNYCGKETRHGAKPTRNGCAPTPIANRAERQCKMCGSSMDAKTGRC